MLAKGLRRASWPVRRILLSGRLLTLAALVALRIRRSER